MRKYAFLKNNKVVDILDLEEEDFIEKNKQFDMGIDIQDISPLPQIGWRLLGNSLIPNLTSEEAFEIQCTNQRIFGTQLALQAVDRIGARNLKLINEGQVIDIVAISTSLQQVKMLLDGGALKTAIGLLTYIRPSFPNYADIINHCIAEISSFLVNNGY